METRPWRGRRDVLEADDAPAVFVSRADAIEFCDRLTLRDRERKLISGDMRYRLPTEAEWEHAARSGWTTTWCFGDSASLLDRYANTPASGSGANAGQMNAVGGKLPNGWGLFDIYGNVAEWCLDGGSSYSPSGEDPYAPLATDDRNGVVRGGGCFDNLETRLCTSAGREVVEQHKTASWIGFRVLLDPTPQATAPGRSLSPRAIVNDVSRPTPLISPFTPHQAQAAQAQWAKMLGRPVVEEHPYGIKMVLIPPGEFGFGVSSIERRQFPGSSTTSIEHEITQRTVTLTRPFWLSETEMTKGQLLRLIEKNPPFKTRAEARGDVKHAWNPANNKFDRRGDWKTPGFEQPTETHPGVMISRKDVEEICKALSESANLKSASKPLRYRFPMEDEWEYACRAGTTTPFWMGDQPSLLTRYANGLSGRVQADGSPPAEEPDGYVFTAPCGSFPPNGFGLFDMSGNVWEWCQVRPTGTARVEFTVRGGGFINTPAAHYLRSAHRTFVEGTDGWAFLGVRLAADLEY